MEQNRFLLVALVICVASGSAVLHDAAVTAQTVYAVSREHAKVGSMTYPVVVDGKWTTQNEWTDSLELPLKASNGTILGYLRMKYGNESLFLMADIFSKPLLQGNGCDRNPSIVRDTAWIILDPGREAGRYLSGNQIAFSITGDFAPNGTTCHHNVWSGAQHKWTYIGNWHISNPWLGSIERIDSLQSPYDPYSSQRHVVIEVRITWPLYIQASNPFGFMFYFFSKNFPQISWPLFGESTTPSSWGDLLLMSHTAAAAYRETWCITITVIKSLQHPCVADILVKYSVQRTVAPSPMVVDVSFAYVNSTANIGQLGFYNITAHLRNAPNGTDVAVSATDSLRTNLTLGEEYKHVFAVRVPHSGRYFVTLTWEMTTSAGYYQGGTIPPSERVSFDTSWDPDRMPQVSFLAPTLIVTLEPPNTITGSVVVDGRNIPITGGKIQVNVNPGEHLIQVPGQVDLGQGKRAVFDAWSDADKSNPKIVTSEADLALTAFYKTQYLLTVMSDNGALQGSGWYDSATQARISAPQSTGFLVIRVFDHWEGNFSGTAPSLTIVMNGPKTVRAVWRTDYTQLLIVIALVATITIGAVVLTSRRVHRKEDTSHSLPIRMHPA